MIIEHDRVVLTSDLPVDGLEVGDVGTVIHIYDDGAGYEVEFVALDGTTAAVVTVPATAIRPVRAREVAHARQLTVA
jgi:hypothetical protein